MNDSSPVVAQRWDADGYARNARFVADLGVPVVALLAPHPGERILDLGCGDGALTQHIARSGAVVVGVDSSPELVAAARIAGIDARVGGGEELQFNAAFDAVFSNAALHWMTDYAAVLDGVFRALRPGGRFIGELGGHGNVASIRAALRSALRRRAIPVREPWYFPTAEQYARALREHGFTVETCMAHTRPTPLPTGLRGWLLTFAGPFFAGVAPERQREVLDETVDILAPILCDTDGRWTADYVRVRFSASRA